jgi:hypothetical protein
MEDEIARLNNKLDLMEKENREYDVYQSKLIKKLKVVTSSNKDLQFENET